MSKIIAVARREFVATVRTKAFVLSVVLMPGIIVAAIFGGQWVEKASKTEKRPVRQLAVVDRGGHVYEDFAQRVELYNNERPNQRFAIEETPSAEVDADASTLADRITQGDLYGYLIFSENIIAMDGEGCVMARKDNQLETGRQLERMVNDAVFAVRCREAELDPLKVFELQRPIPIQRMDLTTGKAGASNPILQFMTPFAFMFLLFMGTFGISQGLLTTLIEEKGSRVVEVLLSAVSPVQLLAGKIIGLALVGFLLMGVWGGVGFAAAQRYALSDLVTGYRVGIALLYFVPGFLLIASLLAAIGSACNELKDAQSMVFPLSLITIVPMIFWYFIAEHPSSAFSLALSYIPPITPFVMILRVCADPHTPLWQIISTLGLLWIAVLVAIWAAAKIFRVGVLMYGKPPSLSELLRWVRAS